MEETSREVTVVNRLGLHARPAAEFVKLSSGFACTIFVAKGELEVNGKSIMGVMMLAAEAGSVLRIRGSGVDSHAAVEALCALVSDHFGEADPHMYAQEG
ncbi:MAG: HPr family phosphocarrier protein [Gemmatimonadota bacterium]